MRRHRRVRLRPLAFALVGMFGALGLGVHAVAAAPSGYSVVSFDDRIKTVRPGEGTPARVSNQYRADLGIEFHEDLVYDVGAPIDGGLARSGSNAIACYGRFKDSCPRQIGWSFDAPQGWIEVWVGFDGPHPDGVPISITGSDAQGQEVVRNELVLPASNDPTPANTPVWAATADGKATIVEVAVRRIGGDLDSVLIDDVAFAQTTPPPDLALTGATLTAADGSIFAAGSIVNVGPVPVDPFVAQVDGPAGQQQLPFGGLAPGQSVLLAATLDVPAGLPGPTAHVRIFVAPDLSVPDSNPADNVIEQDVTLPPPPSAAATVAPSAPPSVPPTATPTGVPGPPVTSTDLSPILLVVAAVVGVALAGGAIRKLWPRRVPPEAAQTAEIRGEATTANGVKVSIDVNGEHASATVEFDKVTVSVDSGGSASLEVKDGPPPKSCPSLRPGNLANGQCWYAQRQVMAAPGDGHVRALTIVVEGASGYRDSVAVPDQLTQRILQLDGARDRQAATAAILGELSERATNLAGSVDGARQLTIQGRVAWLKVPAQVTLFACLGTGAEGAFKKLKPLQHTWDILRERDLATRHLSAGEEPGDAIRNVVAAAIDQAGRPQPLF